MQCYISVYFFSCYRYHLIPIPKSYKDMQYCYAYSFTIFQHRSHRYDIYSHYELILISDLMTVMIFWFYSALSCVTNFHSNLDNITIINAPKCVTIHAFFLRLGPLGGILVFFFFIATVTSCCLFYISTRVVLVTVSFPVGLCEIMGYVGVSFSTYLWHTAWVEASFEFLAVNSIEEQ